MNSSAKRNSSEMKATAASASSSGRSSKKLNHPPQVESASCYCRAEAPNAISSHSAKKFVPATARHCVLQEEAIKPPPAVRSRSRARSNGSNPQLIPGLPDDLAIACLIRVPRFHHRALRIVCKRWHRLLAGNFFYTQRRIAGLAEEWVFVIKRDNEKEGGRISWHAFDPRFQQWQPLPPIPQEFCEALGFGCAVLGGCHLYLFGGKDPAKGSMRRVVFYSARTNRWHRAPEMLKRRHFFGSGVIDNCLFVAGGECEGVHRSLRSAEVYDPARNRWSYISDMSTAMVPFIGVVYGGNWFVKGLGSHRQVMSEVYIPGQNVWSPILDGMVSGWRNPSVALGGTLYALDCPDGCKLRVYDPVSDTWKRSVDSKFHLGNSRALEAAALLPLDGKLCIVRNNMSITVVDVGDGSYVGDGNDGSGGGSSNARISQVWETIAGKGHFKTFVTNLLSNIAGRSRLKSHIVHCQALSA
ncbi:hypothetical protein SELMODRAFT_438121 [Selaginella moellendorffii]|uniref:F-box domain-containing protein n=1 Tax=Selaginella moellendorffii TaxID=88036 RepID=D8QU85_SELML|nr:F-box/kelch-repeat protein At1g55270 [Selaginella moellendorffii]EFJ36255.1 hypothetical protein SELMODRAFT_438121 [Selaginella moellendorffii]|eukprot:XP_002962792.1 F-box/kelch-repeat protein At1g55270 [Selaginella moellendorffii]